MRRFHYPVLAVMLLLLAASTQAMLPTRGGDVGYYRIDSSPQGADVWFDNDYRGTTPVLASVYSSGTPSHTLRVEKTGYLAITQNLQGNPQPGETLPISVTLSPMPGGDTGYFQIDSVPSNGDVYFDDRFVGETPVTVQVPATGTPQHTVRVACPGYIDWLQQYNQNPLPGGTINVMAYLQPIQNTGSVYVTSDPPGATATLDGGDSFSTPASFPVVPVGTHTLTVFRSGYQPYYVSLNVYARQTTTINAILAPVMTTGSLQVYSSPVGASVFVDGIYYGSTPATVGNLAPGSHPVKLRLAGYSEYSSTVTISPGATTSMSPTLIPNPASGFISVTSYPSGASIYLDDVFQGKTTKGQSFNILDVQPGSHVIHLSIEGYQDYTATIAIVAGQTTPVAVTFTPAPAEKTGNIEIISSPSGAEVYVDNVFSGYTPMNVQSVTAGTHALLLRLGGYQDWQTTLQVTAGSTSPVTATITPTPAPTKSGVLPLVLAGALSAATLLALRRKG